MAATDKPGALSGSRYLDEAATLETPDDCIRLYQEWASSYDDNLIIGLGSVHHQRLADRFAEVAKRGDGPVLDVGCGTGLLGAELSLRGGWAIDGLDISPEMLAEAVEKSNPAGEPLYGTLITADLTRSLAAADNTYGSVVSAGLFKPGHAGPGVIGELVRITRPGGLLVLGVDSDFYSEYGFDRYLASLVNEGSVGGLSVTVEPVYVGSYEGPDHDHATDTAHLIVMRAN